MKEFFSEYEDKERKIKECKDKRNQYSKYCDFVYYKSTIHPELTLAMRILKPSSASYIIASTHGWHMSICDFEEMNEPQSDYLKIQVDMRGRAFSDGKQDCNGWELYDIIDAIEYVKNNYKEYIIDERIIYFEAGSGGGGNAFALAGKFPDYFAHITALSGMSDYALWYANDKIGEFRDEMDIWIGDINNTMAYASRSGITSVNNLCSPLTIIHGEKDIRVPAYHSTKYVEAGEKAGKKDLISYLELPEVGGQDHYDNITDIQKERMAQFCEEHRQANRVPISIPRKGVMKVCGYLFTKEFFVVLNDINMVAEVEYDIDSAILNVIGVGDGEYIKNIVTIQDTP